MYLLFSQQKKLFNSFPDSPVWWKSSQFSHQHKLYEGPSNRCICSVWVPTVRQFSEKMSFFFHFWLVVHHSFKAFKKYIVYELIFFFFSVFSHHKILLATIIYQNLILVMISIIPHTKHNFFLNGCIQIIKYYGQRYLLKVLQHPLTIINRSIEFKFFIFLFYWSFLSLSLVLSPLLLSFLNDLHNYNIYTTV